MHRRILLTRLDQYQPGDPGETAMHQRLRAFVVAHTQCFHRTLAHGHITGSSWIVNPARDRVLLLHHRKLDRWLQPGGHSDGDPNTLCVALREAAEETGVPCTAIRPVSSGVFDLDIHTIPARGAEPEHEHFDIRFLFELDDRIPLKVSPESHALAWVPLSEVVHMNPEASISRMVAKTRRL